MKNQKEMYKFYPVVDVHATWLVLNPIQGCPKKCKYCFLRERGLNKIKPVVLATPEEAVEKLLNSKFYIEDMPLCLFSQTDAFATPSNIEYAKQLVNILMQKDIKNPIIFITKCRIPIEFIEFIDYYEKQGKQFIFFLSYSGLESNIEVGVDKEDIQDNFIFLSKYNKKIVHYWRPLIPENSQKTTIDEVYKFVKKYSIASVTIGLKITEDIMYNIGWEELVKNKEKALKVNNVWNKYAYDYIWGCIARKEEIYPMFQTTACAVAYALKQPDRKFFYNTEVCKVCNKCPKEQRNLCDRKYQMFKYPEKEYIIRLINDLGKDVTEDQIELDLEKRLVVIKNTEMSFNEISFLREKIGMKISVGRSKNDYYWNSEIIDTKILKI